MIPTLAQAPAAARPHQAQLHDDAVAAAHRAAEDVLAAIGRHEAYRADCVGLVPTENRMSPMARRAQDADLAHRYLFQNPQWRYVGGKHLAEVEGAAQTLARDVFGAAHVNVRPLSGENCTNVVIHALVEPGDAFYHLRMEDGGHFAAASVADRITDRRRYLPYDAERAVLDLEGCARAFAETPPDVIYLDASMVLFAHPLRELRALAGPDAIIVYDASQVLGLLAGGAFQDPLREGADVLSGSTHKSLPGPQKGLIATNRADLMARVDATIFPGHVSNFHLHHVASLAVTLAEAQAFGAAYAHQTIANARAFGRALRAQGLAVQGGAAITDSHQVWLDVRGHGGADAAVERLHAANLIANVNLIPSLGAKGLRLGTPEVTRLGMVEADMERLAGFVHRALTADPAGLRAEVAAFARRFATVRYCFPDAA